MKTIVFEDMGQTLQHIRLSDNGMIIGCFPIQIDFHSCGGWVRNFANLKSGDIVYFEKLSGQLWQFKYLIKRTASE